MAQTEAQLRASRKYHQEKIETLALRVPKGEKEIIQQHAAAMGESTNAFIYRAVNEAIERDQKTNK